MDHGEHMVLSLDFLLKKLVLSNFIHCIIFNACMKRVYIGMDIYI